MKVRISSFYLVNLYCFFYLVNLYCLFYLVNLYCLFYLVNLYCIFIWWTCTAYLFGELVLLILFGELALLILFGEPVLHIYLVNLYCLFYCCFLKTDAMKELIKAGADVNLVNYLNNSRIWKCSDKKLSLKIVKYDLDQQWIMCKLD